jgi:hypothetical protein
VERNPAGINGANEFVFYDGPPFGNGLPHYGHLLTGYWIALQEGKYTLRVMPADTDRHGQKSVAMLPRG